MKPLTHNPSQVSVAGVLVIVSVTLIASLFSAISSGSPLVTLVGGLTLAALIFMFWRPDNLPIFLMPLLYQWLEVAVRPILSLFTGQNLEDVLNTGARVQTVNPEAAAIFGFLGIACLGLGMFVGTGKPGHSASALRIEVHEWNRGVVLRVSLAALAVGHAAGIFAGVAGPAYQLVLAFSGAVDVGIFVLAYWCFANAKGYRYLIVVMTFEIVSGMTGFFADFRSPVLVLAIAAVAARPSFRLSSIAIISFIAIGIVTLAAFWSEIKNDYRNFADAGGGAQTASAQPLEARLNFVANAAYNFDTEQLVDGFNRLLSRFSYTDFLGATLAYVPRVVPHEDGRLIGMALENIFMPRILFPDKPPLPADSDVTVMYTGMDASNIATTSISIGYLGELYIDFGYWIALFATFVIGAGLGIGYRVLRDYKRSPRLINYGTCAMLALSFLDFGTALTKSINGAVLTFGAAIIFQRFILPKALKLMRGFESSRAQRRWQGRTG